MCKRALMCEDLRRIGAMSCIDLRRYEDVVWWSHGAKTCEDRFAAATAATAATAAKAGKEKDPQERRAPAPALNI